MGYNNFTSNGNLSSYNMWSTNEGGHNGAVVPDGTQGTPYTVGQLEGILNTSAFNVAIDVNTTGAAGETLQLFEVVVNGVVAYNFVGPTLIGNINNNGNGYGDWTLGTIDLSSFNDNSTVLFHAVWNSASDGAESFFLLGSTPVSTVPELSTWAMMLLGFAGVGLFGMRGRPGTRPFRMISA